MVRVDLVGLVAVGSGLRGQAERGLADPKVHVKVAGHPSGHVGRKQNNPDLALLSWHCHVTTRKTPNGTVRYI